MKYSYFNALKLSLILSFFTFLTVGANAGGIDTAFNANVQTTTFLPENVYQVITLPDGKTIVSGDFNLYNSSPVSGLIRLNPDKSLDPTFNNRVWASPLDKAAANIVILPDGKYLITGFLFRENVNSPWIRSISRLNSDGTIDSSFNYSLGGDLSRIDIDSNGRILLGGGFQINQNGVNTLRRIIRLKADGTFDPTFNAPDFAFQGMIVQGNKIIYFEQDEVLQRLRMLRLNEDGTTDVTFTPILISNSGVRKYAVLPDNKILLEAGNELIRVNENGGNDDTFHKQILGANGWDMFTRNGGPITVVHLDSSSQFINVVRFLPDGTPDPSYTRFVYKNSIPAGFVLSAFAMEADGGILVGESGLNSTSNSFKRILPTGLIDSNFNAGNFGFQTSSLGKVETVRVLSNGKIALGGDFDKVGTFFRSKIAVLNDDGSVNQSFDIHVGSTSNRFTNIQEVYDISVQTDRKLLVNGNFQYTINGVQKSNIVRLNPDGSIDTGFVVSAYIQDAAVANGFGTNETIPGSNGKVLVGASRSNLGEPTLTPTLFDMSGTKDPSFTPTIFSNKNGVGIFHIAVQADGKILISGRHTAPTITADNQNGFIARLNANGTTDSSFAIYETPDKIVKDFSILADGRILAVLRTNTKSSVIALDRNGSIDTAFPSGPGANGKINSIAVLPNGSILVGGLFSTYNGQPRKNLAAFKADGTLASDFGSTNGEVLKITVDSHGRVLVGGQFTSISAGAQQIAAAKGQAARSGGSTLSVSQAEDVAIPYLARFKADDTAARPASFDFDGDGMSDTAVWRENGGIWFVTNSSNGSGPATQFGQPGDRIVPGDFDGDGKTDLAVWRPSNGIWYLQQSNAGFTAVQWGLPTDLPTQGDFDGDGKTDIAVWRPSSGIWFVINSSNGQLVATQFGQDGDRPVAGDYDGDGKTDLAVFRPSSGIWFIRRSTGGDTALQFGMASDKVVPADYDGDGKTDIAVYRDGILGMWYLQRSTAGYGERQFGTTGDVPAAGDFDGDGNADITVWRPSNGVWYMQQSTSGYTVKQFGQIGDKPLPAAYVPFQ